MKVILVTIIYEVLYILIKDVIKYAEEYDAGDDNAALIAIS